MSNSTMTRPDPMREADCLQLEQVQATVRAWCELGGGTMTLVRRNGATLKDLEAAGIASLVEAAAHGHCASYAKDHPRDHIVLTIERDEVES